MLPSVTRTIASLSSISCGLGLSVMAKLPFSIYIYASMIFFLIFYFIVIMITPIMPFALRKAAFGFTIDGL